MVEPLRKREKNGSLYRRRESVESELRKLEKLRLPEILARAKEGEQPGNTLISSEALVYFLRQFYRVGSSNAHGVYGLLGILTTRAEKVLKRHISSTFGEIQREEICEEVIDGIVDMICDTSDVGDYAEVNFNSWLALNRYDACNKRHRQANHLKRTDGDVEDLDIGKDGLDPDALTSPITMPDNDCAMKLAQEEVELPNFIMDGEFSPEELYRIGALAREAKLDSKILEAFLLYHYWGMPIDSKDVDKQTLRKRFNVYEKTIRNWLGRAEKAFSKIRSETNE